jgi:hypothetical protein
MNITLSRSDGRRLSLRLNLFSSPSLSTNPALRGEGSVSATTLDDDGRLSSTEKYSQIFFSLRAPFFLFFALLGRATTRVNA